MLYFIILLLKLSLLSVLIFVGYVIYKGIIVPYMFKREHRQYSNVYVTNGFVPFFGDLADSIDDVKNGKVFYNNVLEKAKNFKNIDLKVSIEGMQPEFKLVSAQAVREFFELNKEMKIDRMEKDKILGFLIPNSTNQLRTTPEFLKRKKEYLHLFDHKNTSKLIPQFIELCKDISGDWKKDEVLNLSNEISHLVFSLIFRMTLGSECYKMIDERIEGLDYINQQHEIERVPFRKFMSGIVKDSLFSSFNPLSTFIPFLRNYALIEPFKRDAKNWTTIKTKLSEVMENCKDDSSLFSKGYTMLDDVFAFLYAGAATPANAAISWLYFLKKNPEVETKLRKSLAEAGITSNSDVNDPVIYEQLQDIEYLNYAIKETLRYDCAVIDTFEYEANEDVKICDVTVKKGVPFKLEIASVHHNPKEWINPTEFIPERFDPESEYFFKPSLNGKVGKKATRDPYSYIPFGVGMRSCTGQSLAWMIVRTVLVYLLLNFDIHIDKKQLDNDTIGFAFGSNIDLLGTIKSF